MTVFIAILIVASIIVIIIEEWIALTDNSAPSSPKSSDQEPNKSRHPHSLDSNNFLAQVDIKKDFREQSYEAHTDWVALIKCFSWSSLIGSVSGLLVRLKQYQLRTKSLSRFRRNNRNSSDESCQTLIDMNCH